MTPVLPGEPVEIVATRSLVWRLQPMAPEVSKMPDKRLARNPAVVCTVYGGDPVRAAQEGNRPETAAAVAEALMRRRIADSPSRPESEPTAAARRRRVSI